MGPTVLLSCPALLTNDQNKILDLWTRELSLSGLAIQRLERVPWIMRAGYGRSFSC